MDTADGVRAVRNSVTLCRPEHLTYVRLRGDAVFDAVDHLYPREIYLRDGQLNHGLLLDPDGGVVADCYLGSDEDEFFLLAETAAGVDLMAHMTEHTAGFTDLELADESPGHGCIGIDGPYAWELMADLVGQEVIGLPYLTFFHFGEVLCCRVGRTGEYGYVLIVPLDGLEPLWARVRDAAGALDGRVVGTDVIDACALENWFFNVRAEGVRERTPLELQLQWRVSRRKEFVGSAALAERRLRGIDSRLTCLVGEQPMHVKDPVVHGGGRVGEVLDAGYSHIRNDWIALALLDLDYAHPGIHGFQVGDAPCVARSVSPPVVNNRSLYVNPQVHTYATREETEFPALTE